MAISMLATRGRYSLVEGSSKVSDLRVGVSGYSSVCNVHV